jgi:hypothetical protein
MSQIYPVPTVPGYLVRLRRGHVAWLLGLALSFGLTIRAQAATTWTVCASGCDYSSIKAAIAAPTILNGDTLALAAGPHTEAGITVNKSLTLQGEGAGTTMVQAATTPGKARDRVFTIGSGVTVTIRDLTIRYGMARSYPGGGGLYNAGTLTLTDCTIRNNGATYGGGLYNAGTLTLTNSTVHDNGATYYGGGLYSYGTLTLTNSTISSNGATYGGGLYGGGTLFLTNSTVRNNDAGLGGGLYSYGTLTLTNSTISGNAAGGGGGGLYGGGTLTLINSTVSGNTTESSGGGIYHNGGTLTLTNSLVAKNPDGGDCFTPFSSAILSHGYNLDSDRSCHLTAATDLPGTDPLLGPLQDNGGPTFTQALLSGSPAIDAIPWGTNGCGTTLVSDQRWQARPHALGGACDIGAYEVAVAGQALAAWVTGFTPHAVDCQNVTTGQVVALSDPGTWWDCETAGLAVTSGDRVSLLVRGPVKKGAPDVGGAVTGLQPSSGSCSNLTTGQSVAFEQMVGATAASCVAAGLAVHPGNHVQIGVQGAAE